MKLANFTYTDQKGQESLRKVLITGTPSNKYSGIDVTEYTDEELVEFAVEYDRLHDEFLSQVELLKDSLDMKYNYRQFLETGISNMQVEVL